MASYLGYGTGGGVGSGGAGLPPDSTDAGRERGRRKRLAAMAGRVYSAGASAMNEIKESYNQTRVGQIDTPETSKITIPGSFPDVAIVTKGNEQMVLFPSYAKRHVKNQQRLYANPAGPPPTSNMGMDEEEYWRQEWARHEDEKAVVDVDIRGWIYNPHKGPMTRRNRVLIGLARQLSGIPVPQSQQQAPEPTLAAMHMQHEEEREQKRIAQKAQEIERKGQGEKEKAQKGEFSERPKDYDDEDDDGLRRQKSGNTVSPPGSSPGSPILAPNRTTIAPGIELNDAELAVANANLMARLGPFLTTPLVEAAITVFFYNDSTSQSRTVMTNDSGHFVLRAALDFVPTHVRVLANEDISATEPVHIIEPKGISLISDIDDTIKHSNISLGAKEIFRNTFIRDLGGLTVEGVREWYGSLHDMGVSLHYCSNSPWQLFPVIASYFKLAGLPPGSIHLKQYSGMLQGIFEPVAERKKGTLEKIMADFPERHFLLVGDSGEADLEVYTEIAIANPGRIIAIFIRDVTTPEQAGYFDSGFDTGNARNHDRTQSVRFDPGPSQSDDDPSKRPALPPRIASEPLQTSAPLIGDLIDLSDEPAAMNPGESRSLEGGQPALPDRPTDSAGRKQPPPRPAKPSSLQSSPATSTLASKDLGDSGDQRKPPPPPQPRKPTSSGGQSSKPSTSHPLSQMHNLSKQTLNDSQHNLSQSGGGDQRGSAPSSSASSQRNVAPAPPPPRRRATPTSSILSLSPRIMAAKRRSTANSDVEFDPLPNSSYNNPTGSGRSTPSIADASSSSTVPINKKLDLWRRRLERAQTTLDREGVALYTWRRGDDVISETLGIVREKMKEMGFKEGEKPNRQ